MCVYLSLPVLVSSSDGRLDGICSIEFHFALQTLCTYIAVACHRGRQGRQPGEGGQPGEDLAGTTHGQAAVGVLGLFTVGESCSTCEHAEEKRKAGLFP